MKIAITGHTSGIGKYLFDTLSTDHEVYGYSRTNMYDISDDDARMSMLMDVMEKDIDVFINNAWSRVNIDAQHDVFVSLFNAWERNPNKTIINICTKGIIISEPNPYVDSKRKLYDTHINKLLKVGKKCKIMNIAPSYTDTPMVKQVEKLIQRVPSKLTVKEVGDTVIWCMNQPQHVEISHLIIARTDDQDY